MKILLNVHNLCPPLDFPKPSTELDWSLCQTNSGPQALCLTALP